LIIENADFEFYARNKDMIYTGYKFLFEDQRFGSPNIVVITAILKISRCDNRWLLNTAGKFVFKVPKIWRWW
jgi:hypothetical protein